MRSLPGSGVIKIWGDQVMDTDLAYKISEMLSAKLGPNTSKSGYVDHRQDYHHVGPPDNEFQVENDTVG